MKIVPERINEAINFERGNDPKKSMKIGQNRFTVPPNQIKFEVRQGQGWLGNNISIIAPGYTNKSGRKILTADDLALQKLLHYIQEFLNTPEMRLKAAEIIQDKIDESEEGF